MTGYKIHVDNEFMGTRTVSNEVQRNHSKMEFSSITFQGLLNSMPLVLGKNPFPKGVSEAKFRVLNLKLQEVNGAEKKKKTKRKEVHCESCRNVDKAQTPEKPEY